VNDTWCNEDKVKTGTQEEEQGKEIHDDVEREYENERQELDLENSEASIDEELDIEDHHDMSPLAEPHTAAQELSQLDEIGDVQRQEVTTMPRNNLFARPNIASAFPYTVTSRVPALSPGHTDPLNDPIHKLEVRDKNSISSGLTKDNENLNIKDNLNFNTTQHKSGTLTSQDTNVIRTQGSSKHRPSIDVPVICSNEAHESNIEGNPEALHNLQEGRPHQNTKGGEQPKYAITKKVRFKDETYVKDESSSISTHKLKENGTSTKVIEQQDTSSIITGQFADADSYEAARTLVDLQLQEEETINEEHAENTQDIVTGAADLPEDTKLKKKKKKHKKPKKKSKTLQTPSEDDDIELPAPQPVVKIIESLKLSDRVFDAINKGLQPHTPINRFTLCIRALGYYRNLRQIREKILCQKPESELSR